MPYIEKERREILENLFPNLPDVYALTVGEINYLITRILLTWIGDPPSYALYSAARGVVADVADELYRKRVAPYEDKKCMENGDVY